MSAMTKPPLSVRPSPPSLPGLVHRGQAGVRLAQPLAQRDEYLILEPGDGVQEVAEDAPVDDQQRHRLLGDDRRRPWLTADEGHLAEEVARPKARYHLPVALHPRPPPGG